LFQRDEQQQSTEQTMNLIDKLKAVMDRRKRIPPSQSPDRSAR